MLNIQERRKKEVRRIESELLKLRYARCNLGLYKLDKPIRNGWIKYLTLREDIARRKDAEVFQNIIDVAGMKIWGRDKKHLERVWTRANHNRKEVVMPGIYKLDKKQFDKLSPNAKKHFEGFERYWSSWTGSDMRYYCHVPRYYFKTTYSKAYITHRKVLDPIIDKRIEELESKLLAPEFYDLSYCSYYRDEWRRPFLHKRIRRKVKTSLQNLDPDSECYFWVYSDMAKSL